MKNWIQVFSIIDFISVGILLTAIAMNAFRRLESYLRAYILNSWLLSLLIAIVAFMVGETHLYIASVTTLVSKGIIIPMLLKKIVREMDITYDDEPYISNTLSLAIAGILVAVVLIGLLIMITRKKAITQVIGLLCMENGLFLAGFSLTFGMPIIIELGVLFDMLMGVIILGIFSIQIKRAFASADLDKLTILKG